METQQASYDVCRAYLTDRRTTLDSETYDYLQGNLRARNLAVLCDSSSLIDWHRHPVETVRTLLQVQAFFKKNAAFTVESVCADAARRSFLRSEKLCRITNKRLDYYYAQRDRLDPDLSLWLSRMERRIAEVLGPIVTFRDSIPKGVRLTSGATASQSRANSLPFMKMRREVSCPRAAEPYLRCLYTYFGYRPPRIRTSSTNRVEAVPKNWKTHRTIACEPDGALPFQLAFDSYVKVRLKRKLGIDLSDQSRNQELARLGSVDGSFATIDLAAASDTVAYNAVAWLFPEPWFQYMCAFRSSTYKGAFGYGKYSKFSSMGNGMTFCIETLIFAAAAVAVGAKDFSVYGDDIILETELYPKLLRLLRFLGFEVNATKTFTSGPFRESCGENWYRGISVTPVYIKDEATSLPDMAHLVNSLVRASDPFGAVWVYLRDYIKERKIPLVPYSENTTTGIMIDPHSAYSLGIIESRRKTRLWVPLIRAIVPKGKTVGVADSRTLFLWYHDAFRIRELLDISERRSRDLQMLSDPIQRSRTTLPSRRYVRKWIPWHPPGGPTPDHLYWWSDHILRES